MILYHQKQLRVLVAEKIIRSFQVQPQMGLYEESRGLVFVGKAVVLCSIHHIYEIFIFMSMKDAFVVFFHTLTAKCYKFATLPGNTVSITIPNGFFI